jgi:hypothetical protein
MAWYSKRDRIIRKFVPSVAKASYNPFVKLAGNAIAGVLSRPFPELRELPPNYLRIRIGTGNRIFNNLINFIQKKRTSLVNFPFSKILYIQSRCGRARLWL